MKKLLLLALLLVAFDVAAQAACSSPCVQTAKGFIAASGSSLQFTFPSSQTANNENLVSFAWCANGACNEDPSGNTVSVTDDAGNTYTVVTNRIDSAIRFTTYIAENINADASNEVTISISGASSVNFLTGIGTEFSGLSASPVDQTATADGSSTTPTVTSGTTTQATEVVYGAVIVISGTADPTVGSGYNLIDLSSDVLIMAAEYKEVSSTGTQTADWAVSPSAGWNAAVITLKSGGGGGGGGGRPLILSLGR